MKRNQHIHDGGQRNMALAGFVLAICLTCAARAAGPGLHGRVLSLDESGNVTGVIAGANIDFSNQAGIQMASATSGQGGYYRVELAPGQYVYKVTAPGYEDEDQGRGVSLKLSEGYAIYNFSLAKGAHPSGWKPSEIPAVEIGKLEGRVLQRTSTGKLVGIPGARISLRRSGAGRQLSRVFTRGPDESDEKAGQFEVILQTGSWRASAAAPGFETYADPTPVAIQNEETATRDFVLTRIPCEVTETTPLPVATADHPDAEPTVVTVRGYVLTRSRLSPTGFTRVPSAETFWTDVARRSKQIASADGRGEVSLSLETGTYDVVAKGPRGFQDTRKGVTVTAEMGRQLFVLERVPAYCAHDSGRAANKDADTQTVVREHATAIAATSATLNGRSSTPVFHSPAKGYKQGETRRGQCPCRDVGRTTSANAV